MALDDATFRISVVLSCERRVVHAKNFLSSMLCAYEIHAFSLGNYLGTSLTIGDFMKISGTSAAWTWLGL